MSQMCSKSREAFTNASSFMLKRLQVHTSPTDSQKQCDMANSILDNRKVDSERTAKISGIATSTDSKGMGRPTMTCIRPWETRAHSQDTRLRTLIVVVLCSRPRLISLKRPPAMPLIIYTIVAEEPGHVPGCFEIADKRTDTSVEGAFDIPRQTVRSWNNRKKQITIVLPITPDTKRLLQGQDIIKFIDNVAAQNSVIMVSSSQMIYRPHLNEYDPLHRLGELRRRRCESTTATGPA